MNLAIFYSRLKDLKFELLDSNNNEFLSKLRNTKESYK